MQSLSDIKQALDSFGLTPKKSLGQNFLIEPVHIASLIETARLAPGDLVLEVGPGTGVLTDVLLEHGCRVVACELDRGLAAHLRLRYAALAPGRFSLIEGDCLPDIRSLSPDVMAALSAQPFKLVANLPYGVASPLMVLLATRYHPALAAAHALPACLGQFVTIQKDVADRVRARIATRDYSELSVMIQAMADVARIAVLPPGCFWPPPSITSEMISIIPRPAPLTTEPARLEALCHRLFTQRRKQLGSILGRDDATLAQLPAGASLTMRPEELTVEQLAALAHALPPA